MPENIKIEVVTPQKAVVKEDAKIVMSPGIFGEFGALIGHTPFLTTLKPGAVHYMDVNGKERFVFVSGGFAETLPDKVTILAESAERRSSIDNDRAKAAKERAQKRLEDQEADIDLVRAKAALERALKRLDIAS